MEGRIKHVLHVVVLVLYCSYAMSPIYLSAMAARSGWIAQCGHQDKSVTLGIVWVNVLLSRFFPAHHCLPAATTEMIAAEHDREFILIKKKRAVLRESFQVRPDLVQQADVSFPAVTPAKPLSARNALCRQKFRYEDLSNFCHGGLSPPLPSA